MKKHFIFDLDDTLTNSYDYNQQMFVDTFLLHDRKIDEQYLRNLHYSTRGKAMDLIFQEGIEHLKLDLDPLQLTKENEELHIKSFEQISFFEGTAALLERLKEKGKLISLCTNRQYGSLNKIIDKYDLRKYFENIVSCKDEGHEKPDPYCLNQIIEKNGDNKDAYVYFGDSKVDYEFAESAGIDFIIFDHYINKKKLFTLLLEAFL